MEHRLCGMEWNLLYLEWNLVYIGMESSLHEWNGMEHSLH